jgi:hypothetical protein
MRLYIGYQAWRSQRHRGRQGAIADLLGCQQDRLSNHFRLELRKRFADRFCSAGGRSFSHDQDPLRTRGQKR